MDGLFNRVFVLPPLSFEYMGKAKTHETSFHVRTLSAEPIATPKIDFHRRGSQSLDLAKAEVARAASEYHAFNEARAALSARKRKEAKRLSNHSIHSVSAQRHLCSKCQIFPLESCLNSPQAGRIWTSPLKRLLWHKDDCPLCSIMVRSLSQPVNDPFKHPTVLANLPNDIRQQTMATWLSSTSLDDTWLNTNVSSSDLQRWPFGIEMVEEEKELANTEDASSLPFAAASGLTQGFVASLSVEDGDIHSSHGSQSVQATSPCYIAISNHFTAPGLLDVKLWGYPRGPRTEVIALSSFRLRIESKWPRPSLQQAVVPLSYGHILDSNHVDLSLGRMWLEKCEQSHAHSCSKQAWPFKLGRPESLRLVDVDELSVIEVNDSQVWSYRYLALSYVRGEAQTFQLMQHNKSKVLRTHGLLKVFRNSLPRTIRDAILATRGFGERYLWVDSLCVIHDDDTDMHQQSGNMDRIYGNALLTIVAADAESADGGLAGVEPGSRHLDQIYEEIDSGVHMMLPLPEPKGLESSIWNSRAWTFQERLLSRRLVIFIEGRMIWRCQRFVAFEDMTAAESGGDLEKFPLLSIRPQQLGIKKPTESHLDCSVEKLRDGRTQIRRTFTFKEYSSLVAKYSQKRLHHSSDALRAFAGLSHVLELCFKGPMRQGLPETLLDAALLWRPVERLRRRDSECIPSWSWAGWEGPVKFEDAFRVDTNDWALKRIASDNGIEAFRPLLRYFVWGDKGLEKINSHGIGVPLPLPSEDLPHEWDNYPPMLSPRQGSDGLRRWDCIIDDIENLLLDAKEVAQSRVNVEASDLPASVLPHLGGQHLIFRASCTEAIQFGRLKRSAILDPKIPLQYPILQGAETRLEKQVGQIRLDGDRPRTFDSGKHSLIVISEALYFSIDQSCEREQSDSEFPLYNVMLIEWNAERTMASRLGLGRIYKEAWKTFDPSPEARLVILE